MTFLTKLWGFLKDVMLFGVEVFVMAISREIGRRFWIRLKERGAAIGVLEAPREAGYSGSSQPVRVASGNQSTLPFLDEYQD